MSSGTQYTVDPSHSLNPYDYVGQYHNEGVAAVLNAFDESQGDLGSQLPMLSTDFMNSLGFEVDNSIYPILAGTNYFVSGWEGTIADQIASDMGFSSQAKGFLNALIGYVTSFDYSVPGDLSLISDIKALELTILSSSLEPEESEAILVASAVARWSSSLWYDVYHDPENTGINLSVLPDGQTRLDWVWQRTVAADLIGGLEWGSAGAVGAAVTGGVGVIPAAAGGWLLGAFFHSVHDIADQM